MSITLNATARELSGKKVKQLRRQGQIPAVLFGKALPSRQVTIGALEFMRLRPRIGSTTLLDINVDSSPPVKALLHHVQTDPRSGDLLHLELYQVSMEDKLKVTVTIHVDGTAPAVSDGGGTLILAHDHVEVKCDANHLISSFHVDAGQLRSFDDHIKVKDLHVPEGVEVLTDPETILVSVMAPRTEVEAVEPGMEPAAVGEGEAETAA